MSLIIFGINWDEELRFMYKNSRPSNGILHRFCLTKGSTLTSQDYDPSSVVYVSKPTRAIWWYLLSEFRALLCCSLSQLENVRLGDRLLPLKCSENFYFHNTLFSKNTPNFCRLPY